MDKQHSIGDLQIQALRACVSGRSIAAEQIARVLQRRLSEKGQQVTPENLPMIEVSKRLGSWGVYRRMHNNPDCGWYRVQPFARFMVRKYELREPFIPHDWTPEIVVDTCIQVMTMLCPIRAFALIVTYAEHYRSAEHRADRMTRLMLQDDLGCGVVSARTYWRELKRGKFYVIDWIKARADENREEENERQAAIEEILQSMI